MEIFDYEKEKRIEKVRGIALKKISFKMCTESEIRKLLKDKGCTNEEIEDAITFLKEYKYIDDSLYTYYYYKEHVLRKKSKNKIIFELKKKGINDNDIIEGFNKLSNEGLILDEFNLAMEIASKMISNQLSLGKEIDEKFKAKVIRHLLSKGFSSDITYRVLSKINR